MEGQKPETKCLWLGFGHAVVQEGGEGPRCGDLESGSEELGGMVEWTLCCSPGDMAPCCLCLSFLSSPLPLCPLPPLPETTCPPGHRSFAVGLVSVMDEALAEVSISSVWRSFKLRPFLITI